MKEIQDIRKYRYYTNAVSCRVPERSSRKPPALVVTFPPIWKVFVWCGFVTQRLYLVFKNSIYTPLEPAHFSVQVLIRLASMFQSLKSTAVLIASALLAPLVASQVVTPPPGFNM